MSARPSPTLPRTRRLLTAVAVPTRRLLAVVALLARCLLAAVAVRICCLLAAIALRTHRLLTAVALFGLVAAACGGGGGGEQTAPEPSEASGLRVAAVLPSARDDHAFSQSMAEALDRMQAAGLIGEVALSENLFVVSEAGAALRGYAEAGYDLVIAHGVQYGPFVTEIAPDFPGTAFAWGPEVETFGLANVSSYTSAVEQGAYAMGLMAAALADGADVGIIGPVEAANTRRYVDGFAAGVAAGGGTARSVYTDSFSDADRAAEAARSFIDGGAAVLTGTAQMTVGAIGVADERGVPWFGTESSQTAIAPDAVVASQVYRWETVLEDLVAEIAAGRLGGFTYEINFANGGLTLEYNDAYDLAPAIRRLGDETVTAIINGSISP